MPNLTPGTYLKIVDSHQEQYVLRTNRKFITNGSDTWDVRGPGDMQYILSYCHDRDEWNLDGIMDKFEPLPRRSCFVFYMNGDAVG